jgi:hypothetical protein
MSITQRTSFGVVWDEAQLAVAWPDRTPLLSPNDRSLQRLAEVMDQLPRF